jgi:MoxR-like ATPase
VYVADALLDYVQALVRYTRESGLCLTGLSPRAAIALVHAAQAWALLHGRDAVLPEDVQAVLAPVAAHRLESRAAEPLDLKRSLIEAVPIP